MLLQKGADTVTERPLALLLEDLFHGVAKKQKITCRIWAAPGLHHDTKIVDLQVKPGLRSGSKVRLSGVADLEGDIAFVIEEKPHTRFVRTGNDLKHTIRITSNTALYERSTRIPTIDGSSVSVKLYSHGAVCSGTPRIESSLDMVCQITNSRMSEATYSSPSCIYWLM